MTLLLCIGFFFSTNSRAYFIEATEAAEKKGSVVVVVDLLPLLYINNECHASNFSERIWYS